MANEFQGASLNEIQSTENITKFISDRKLKEEKCKKLKEDEKQQLKDFIFRKSDYNPLEKDK